MTYVTSSLSPPTYTFPWGHHPLSLFHPRAHSETLSLMGVTKTLEQRRGLQRKKIKKLYEKNIPQCLHFSPFARSWGKHCHEAILDGSLAFGDRCTLLSHLLAQDNSTGNSPNLNLFPVFCVVILPMSKPFLISCPVLPLSPLCSFFSI